jgi:DNA processing protein
MDQDKLSLLALHFIPGLGDYTIRQLISYCGSAEQVYRTPPGKLKRIPGVGVVTARQIRSGNPFRAAEKELQLAQKEGVRLVFHTDEEFPSRLRHIHDAPTLLYIRGAVDFENPRTVGIVGTRNATDYGKDCVSNLISDLLPLQALIVSGLAYGIDIHAHKAAIQHHLATVGILGSGVDVIYPAVHRPVVAQMLENGGIVSENPMGTKPDAHHFPSRNRIIAGLCDALVVVEAATQGGALITADIANSYNKDIFAFPGNIGRQFSEGCNNLIKNNKAMLITGAADLIAAMNWTEGKPAIKETRLATTDLSPEMNTIMTALQNNNDQLVLDELSWRTSLSVSRLASLLLELEIMGAVKAMPGKVFRIVRY